jgi:hypothetical protein
VTHELLHLILEPIQYPVCDTLWETRLLADSAYQLLSHAVRHESECAIDALARIVAPTLPLPPWAGKEEKEQKA